MSDVYVGTGELHIFTKGDVLLREAVKLYGDYHDSLEGSDPLGVLRLKHWAELSKKEKRVWLAMAFIRRVQRDEKSSGLRLQRDEKSSGLPAE